MFMNVIEAPIKLIPELRTVDMTIKIKWVWDPRSVCQYGTHVDIEQVFPELSLPEKSTVMLIASTLTDRFLSPC